MMTKRQIDVLGELNDAAIRLEQARIDYNTAQERYKRAKREAASWCPTIVTCSDDELDD